MDRYIVGIEVKWCYLLPGLQILLLKLNSEANLLSDRPARYVNTLLPLLRLYHQRQLQKTLSLTAIKNSRHRHHLTQCLLDAALVSDNLPTGSDLRTLL